MSTFVSPSRLFALALAIPLSTGIPCPEAAAAESTEWPLLAGPIKVKVAAGLCSGLPYVDIGGVAEALGGRSEIEPVTGRLQASFGNRRILAAPWIGYAIIETEGVDLGEFPPVPAEGKLYGSLTLVERAAGVPIQSLFDPLDLDDLPCRPPAGELDHGTSIPVLAEGLTIVLDPGHGGEDSGATAVNGMTEKELTFDLASLVKRALENVAPVNILLTRDEDVYVPLRERVEVANRADADLFLSIHANSAQREGAAGVEVFVLGEIASDKDARRLAAFENAVGTTLESEEEQPLLRSIFADMAKGEQLESSQEFANRLHAAVAANMEMEQRGVRQAPFYVLVGATMPAVLMEAGFLTNAKEAERLADGEYRRRYARAIARAVLDYLPILAARRGPHTAHAGELPPGFE